MRTLSKLKLMVIATIITLGMSSCLKTENSFVIYPALAYVLQDANDEYQLQIQIYGNEPIASANATFDSKTYSFSAVSGSQNYYMRLNSSYALPLDSIAGGICQITASNAEGETAVSQIEFRSTEKVIGEVTLTELSYDGDANSVTATWEKVENAEQYYLLFRERSSSYLEENMWIPYSEVRYSDKDGNLTTTLSIPLTKDVNYEIAIGATNGTTLRVSDRILRVVGGTDTSIN